MRAQLLHLTGPRRGKTTTCGETGVLFGSSEAANVRYTEGLTIKPRHASLQFQGGAFHFKALEGEIFVNDREVEEVILESGDLIELGRNGPKMRFRPVARRGRPRKPVSQILRDARDVGSMSGIYASSIALRSGLRQQSTWTFRIVFPLAIVVLSLGGAYLGGWLGGLATEEEETRRREQALEYEREFAALREQIREYQAQQETRASREDLHRIRNELTEQARMVSDLVAEKAAFKRVMDEYAGGVCLLHGRFAFRIRRGGKLVPVLRPDKKRLTLEYVGSGFLVSQAGEVVTNRHVAEPWWHNTSVAGMLSAGLVPEFLSLHATFPGHQPIEIDTSTIRLREDDIDIAVLRVGIDGVPVLPLSGTDAKAMRGGRVMLLGYPTGVNALLARADPDLARAIVSSADDTATLITNLAINNAISPVITQGALNEVKPKRLVYDAETTSGGSGGPVFGPSGEVIGVNFAVTRDFDGSNFGIPIEFARRLLE